MALSRLAREFAAEIANHDWSDATERLDRAGHRREWDSKVSGEPPLTVKETRCVKTNVMWVTAQVLGHADPNFDIHEFARLCGVTGLSPLSLENGLRRDPNGNYLQAPPVA
ncbi:MULTISPECIES: hypothetical protein [Streptosporangium]|uniref:Uncharacterized protein n=1 Tax=Streptosporangium brasiliense TaxID=47480 RepID=A0ABT9RBW6_9ACTN|nr:hypothetical protein [Streptosporangium brasiliense]MDP9866633.1 hypothetical protein [Streptosporangium brasiliense]